MGLGGAAALIGWVASAWEWVVNLNGFQGAAIALSFAGLGYANGAWRDRRVASFKEGLAAEALFLFQEGASPRGRVLGITVESHLWPDPMPGLAWGRWQRFKGRWFQVQHLPFRIRHYGCSLLLWRGTFDFKVVLMWLSATSRYEAMNQVLKRYGQKPLTADEFASIDEPGVHIIWELGHHGYLVLEPALPRWRWKKQRKSAAPNASERPDAEASSRTSDEDPLGYGVPSDGQRGGTP